MARSALSVRFLLLPLNTQMQKNKQINTTTAIKQLRSDPKTSTFYLFSLWGENLPPSFLILQSLPPPFSSFSPAPPCPQQTTLLFQPPFTCIQFPLPKTILPGPTSVEARPRTALASFFLSFFCVCCWAVLGIEPGFPCARQVSDHQIDTSSLSFPFETESH